MKNSSAIVNNDSQHICGMLSIILLLVSVSASKILSPDLTTWFVILPGVYLMIIMLGGSGFEKYFSIEWTKKMKVIPFLFYGTIIFNIFLASTNPVSGFFTLAAGMMSFGLLTE